MAILGETKTRIMKELEDHDLHGYELARRVGIPVTGIYQHLEELFDDGLVSYQKIERRKVYSLTEKGRRLRQVLNMSPHGKQ